MSGALAAVLSDLTVEDIRAEAARRSLSRFVRWAWPIVEPSTPFVDNWHIDELCRHLEMVTRGEIDRLLINVPPGTAKSLIVSVLWPAWEWASDPTKRYLTVSYAQDLATRDALRMRQVITAERYAVQFPVHLREDQNVKTRFDNLDGGWRIATSTGGRATGEHPDRIIFDDPLTAADAESETERKAVIRWIERTASTRGVSRGAAIVGVMQRLHEGDVSGWLLAHETADRWVHLCLPMRAESPLARLPSRARVVARDPRAPGDLLWPALFPEPVVRSLERALGSYGAAGQLQQRPAPEGGGLFKREHFRIVDQVPAQLRMRCRFWDCASTEGGGDWTVGALVGSLSSGEAIVLDIDRFQGSPGTVDSRILLRARMDGHEVRIREEEEGGSSGKAVISARKRSLSGYDYLGRRKTGDKISNWRPFAIQAEAGFVYLLRGDWNAEFIAEAANAPVGAHDDQLDAVAGAHRELTLFGGSMVAGIKGR